MKNLLWSLVFLGDGQVGTITFPYNEPLDGDSRGMFIYSWEDIKRLEAIRKETPEPIFSKDVQEAVNQLAKYSLQIRGKFLLEVSE